MAFEFASSFDTSNALSGIYLWLIFGIVIAHVNCDIRRAMDGNGIIRHIVTLLAFFFLFTIVDGNNKSDLLTTWIKTIVVYILFVLMTKSKWYFIITVLTLLLLDQSLKRHVGFEKNNGKLTEEQEETFKKYSQVIYGIIVILIVIGCLHYMYLQYIQHYKNFSFTKFFIGTEKCKAFAPDYTQLAKRRKLPTIVS